MTYAAKGNGFRRCEPCHGNGFRMIDGFVPCKDCGGCGQVYLDETPEPPRVPMGQAVPWKPDPWDGAC